jgi:nitrite reductase (NO-forming) / hydroxylamine reductase
MFQRKPLLALLALAIAGSAAANDVVNERLPKQGLQAGEAAYLAHCAACHQPNGMGLPGAFPPVAGSDFLTTNDKPKVIASILQGMSGKLLVNGVEYNNVMPAMSHISDADIAHIVNYIYNSWGNPGGMIAEKDVAASRTALAVSTDPAQGSRHPGTKEAEMKYQAGASAVPAGQVEMVVNPDAPPISKPEFERATLLRALRRLPRRAAQGRHRQAADPGHHPEKGTDYLKALITYGSPAGMPNWGTSGELTDEEVDLMARFLQHEPPTPPEFGMKEMRQLEGAGAAGQAPTKQMNKLNLENLFSVTLRDAGEVALIDGDTKEIVSIVKTGYAVHISRCRLRPLCLHHRPRRQDRPDRPVDGTRRVVAEIKIGLEARSVETSKFKGFEDKYAIAGAYWPPQYVIMDGDTLEPLKIVSTRGMTVDTQEYHPEPRVAAIVASHEHPEFIVNVKETGRSCWSTTRTSTTSRSPRSAPRASCMTAAGIDQALLPGGGQPVRQDRGGRLQGAASWPAWSTSTKIPHPGRGANFVHPKFGPVWATSALGNETSPDRHRPRSIRSTPGRWSHLKGQGGGSLFVKTHPKSRNLWVDTPLNPDAEDQPEHRGVRHRQPRGKGYEVLPIAEWAGLGEGPEARGPAGVQQGRRRSLVLGVEAARTRNRRSSWSTTRPASSSRDQGPAPDHADRQVQRLQHGQGKFFRPIAMGLPEPGCARRTRAHSCTCGTALRRKRGSG